MGARADPSPVRREKGRAAKAVARTVKRKYSCAFDRYNRVKTTRPRRDPSSDGLSPATFSQGEKGRGASSPRPRLTARRAPRVGGEKRQRRGGHALDPSGLTQARRPNRGELMPDLVGEARKGGRNRDRAAALRIRRGDSGRRPRPGDRDRRNIWRPLRGGALALGGISASCGHTRVRTAIGNCDCAASSKAERRAPSRLTRRPCAAKTCGVAVAASSIARARFRRSWVSRKARDRVGPTQPSAIPFAVSRSSALSARSDNRNSAREVNMR